MYKFIIVFLGIFVIMAACFAPRSHPDSMNENKSISFDTLWRRVDSLESKNLPASANKIVEKIITLSEQNQRTIHWVKAIQYKIKYLSVLEENGDEKAIDYVADKIKMAWSPAQSLLHFIQAHQLHQYAINRLYKIQNRPQTEELPDQIEDWSLMDFSNVVHYHFLEGLKDTTLKSWPIIPFHDLLVTVKYHPSYHKTLWDLLVYDALQFFASAPFNIPNPVHDFKLLDPRLFSTAERFARIDFVSPDSSNYQYQTLLLFQRAMRFHLQQKDSIALLDVDLQRLSWLDRYSEIPDRSTLYFDALLSLRARYAKLPEVIDVDLRLADYYLVQASLCNSNKPCKYPDALVKAMAIAVDVVENEQYKKPAWKKVYDEFKMLIRKIETQKAQVTLKKAQIPDQNILAVVQYRNLGQLEFALRKITTHQCFELKYQQLKKEKFELIRQKITPLRSWEVSLPDPGDYRNHAVDIKIDPLPTGRYILSWKDKESQVSNYALFHTTNIGFWEHSISKEKKYITIVDRKAGHAIPDVEVISYHVQRKNNEVPLTLKEVGRTKSDNEGIAFPVTQDRSSSILAFVQGRDTFFESNGFYKAYAYHTKSRNKTYWFLDRRIYRPGQLLHFKGIAVEFDKQQNPTILQHKNIDITLRDVNRKVVKEWTVRTNEYGSFSGQTVIPDDLLTGRMTLSSSLGNSLIDFSVEAYKRPKYQVVFDELTTQYALGDTVKVRGLAETYSGAPLTGARVVYTVERRRQMPRWCLWNPYYIPDYGRVSTLIGQGELKVDQQGEFDVPVYLEAPFEVGTYPWYNFHVRATVIDINGERITSEKSIFARQQALFLTASIDRSMTVRQLKEVAVAALNMNGKPVDLDMQYSISAMQRPMEGQMLSRQLWQVDTSIYTRSAFYRYFPDEIYMQDHRPDKWAVRRKEIEGSVQSGYKMDISHLSPGQIYRLSLKGKGKRGRMIVQDYYFEIQDFKGSHTPLLSDYWMDIHPDSAEVGKVMKLQLKFKGNPSPIFRYVARPEHARGEWKHGDLSLDEIQLREEDRGQLFVHWIAMKYNRTFQQHSPILLGWQNKNLDIQLRTFRDKLLPGSEERWDVQINASTGIGRKSEVLATMYDQSLDYFRKSQWDVPIVWPTQRIRSNFRSFSMGNASTYMYDLRSNPSYFLNSEWKVYPSFNYIFLHQRRMYRRYEDVPVAMENQAADMPEEIFRKGEGSKASDDMKAGIDKNEQQPVIRKDLAETVFFYPQLATNDTGKVTLSFKMKEALTKWRLQILAHTEQLEMGYLNRSLVTSKDIMVVPGMPRFLRVDDEILVSVKVVNLSDEHQSGQVRLDWINPQSERIVSGELMNEIPSKTFEIPANESRVYHWRVRVNKGIGALVKYRVTAQSARHSDGEEAMLPILQNKILLTSSMLMQVAGSSTETFRFDDFIEHQKEKENYRWTLQYIGHPVWLAIQALPYLDEPTHRGTDLLADRLFGYALSYKIAQLYPSIQKQIEQWNLLDSDELVSALEKNASLKSVLLKETPWVLQGENETQQKKKIAQLFDRNQMLYNWNKSLRLLEQRQKSDGGFAWFPGAFSSSFATTIHVVERLVWLKDMHAIKNESEVSGILTKATQYLDQQAIKMFEDIKRRNFGIDNWREKRFISSQIIHYLYVRSFPSNIPMTTEMKEAHRFYTNQMKRFWPDFSFYNQALSGWVFHQNNEIKTRDEIVQSLREYSRYKASLGRYWPDNDNNWVRTNVETQIRIMQLFQEVDIPSAFLDEMRLWLMKHKSVNHWSSPTTTVNAIYVLLKGASELVEDSNEVMIKVGKVPIIELSTGKNGGVNRISVIRNKDEMSSELGYVEIQNTTSNANWGALYWQYFSALDEVREQSVLPVRVQKELFKVVASPTGEQLVKADSNIIHSGDEIVSRVIVNIDRPLDYIHLVDMRAAGMEPVDQMSGYKWKGGTSYYKSTTDEASHYYFEHISPGSYVFMSRLNVVQSGNYSVGPAIIESLYAPEYRAQSKGFRVQVRAMVASE